MDEIKKTLSAQLEIAPSEIRSYLSSGQWIKAVDNIAPRYSLLPAQNESLKNEIIFVLLGMELKKNLPQNIQTVLSVPLPIATAIAQSVNEKILTNFEKLLPTEEETNQVSQSGAGLLEDAKGNADNVVLPVKSLENEISKVAEHNITRGEPNILKNKFIPANLPTGEHTPFEKKIADQGLAKEVNQIIKKTYPEIDPYRESL